MIAGDIKERLSREPFEPFQLRSSGGQSYPVINPFQVALMKSKVFIAAPNSDHWAELSYLHIVGIESLANGHTTKPRRKRA